MQVGSNACKGLNNEDEELFFGKNNKIMEHYESFLAKMLEDKDEEPLDEKEKDNMLIRGGQDRSPNIRRKNTKFHSNIVQNVGGFKKPHLRKQKSGSVIILSVSDIPSGY